MVPDTSAGREPRVRRDARAPCRRPHHRARPLRRDGGRPALAVPRTRLTTRHASVPSRRSPAALLLLAACGGPAQAAGRTGGGRAGPARAFRATPNVPDFASKPYEPFSRDAVVAIALREWRMFGQLGGRRPARHPPAAAARAEAGADARSSGSAIGEYWYEGLDLDRARSVLDRQARRLRHRVPRRQRRRVRLVGGLRQLRHARRRRRRAVPLFARAPHLHQRGQAPG